MDERWRQVAAAAVNLREKSEPILLAAPPSPLRVKPEPAPASLLPSPPENTRHVKRERISVPPVKPALSSSAPIRAPALFGAHALIAPPLLAPTRASHPADGVHQSSSDDDDVPLAQIRRCLRQARRWQAHIARPIVATTHAPCQPPSEIVAPPLRPPVEEKRRIAASTEVQKTQLSAVHSQLVPPAQNHQSPVDITETRIHSSQPLSHAAAASVETKRSAPALAARPACTLPYAKAKAAPPRRPRASCGPKSREPSAEAVRFSQAKAVRPMPSTVENKDMPTRLARVQRAGNAEVPTMLVGGVSSLGELTVTCLKAVPESTADMRVCNLSLADDAGRRSESTYQPVAASRPISSQGIDARIDGEDADHDDDDEDYELHDEDYVPPAESHVPSREERGTVLLSAHATSRSSLKGSKKQNKTKKKKKKKKPHAPAPVAPVSAAEVFSPESQSEAAVLRQVIRYGLLILERCPSTGMPSWVACKLCAVEGCAGRRPGYIHAYMAPFQESRMLRHAREHTDVWPAYQEADEAGKIAFFQGKTLPDVDVFKSLVRFLKSIWTPPEDDKHREIARRPQSRGKENATQNADRRARGVRGTSADSGKWGQGLHSPDNRERVCEAYRIEMARRDMLSGQKRRVPVYARDEREGVAKRRM